MANLELTIGCMDYEHTRAVADGTVRIEGATVTVQHSEIVTEIFRDMMVTRRFDVSELGMTYYLRTLEEPDPQFIALPVFPNRQFRHSAIYVNVDSGITAPADLAGKTVGEFALYGHDAGFWIKGILSDDYDVRPERCRWVVGGFDWSMPPLDFVSHRHPANVEITQAPPGKALGPMLEAGEIDALISADVPQCVLNGSPKVRPLFDDPAAVERDYYRRTGIFPIMHTVAVPRELLGEHPDLARALYQGFCAAKDLTARRYRTGRIFNQMTVMLPWANRLVEDNTALLGPDWWPYGVGANRAEIDTILRYHHEQGLTSRLMTAEEIFTPELFDT